MALISDRALNTCLKLLLRPVVRFCLDRSMSLKDIIESAKVVFVELAAEDMDRAGEKVSISRISMMTGVHRKDATKIYREGAEPEGITRIPTRVIGQWKRDRRFSSSSGRPRVLTFRGEDSEFTKLVQTISKEIRPAAVLFELERTGAVTRTKKGLKLVSPNLRLDKHSVEGYRMLSEDVEDLMHAVMENFNTNEGELPNIHIKTEFDNIDAEDIPKVRRWLSQHAYKFYQRAEKALSEYDLDVNPDSKKKGGERVAVGIFSITPEDL